MTERPWDNALAEILARYGEDYQSPAVTGDSEIYDTSNVLGRMRQDSTPTRGMRALADILQSNSTPENVLAGGLNSAANWLDRRPEVGRDMLAPLGLAAFGSAPAGALAASAFRRTPRQAAMEQGKRDLYGLEGKPFEMAADAPMHRMSLEGAMTTFDYHQMLKREAASGSPAAAAARQQLRYIERSGDLERARQIIDQYHAGPTQQEYWRALDAFRRTQPPSRLNSGTAIPLPLPGGESD